MSNIRMPLEVAIYDDEFAEIHRRWCVTPEQLLLSGWRGIPGPGIIGDRPIVIATTIPSTEHPGFVDYEVLTVRQGACTSVRPVHPTIVGYAVESLLAESRFKIDELRWTADDVEIARPRESAKQLPKRNEVVYFLKAGQFVKIGYTNNLTKRLDQLKTGCPYPLVVAATIPGDYETEHKLHRQFAHLRHNGEWFLCTGALAEYIGGLPA